MRRRDQRARAALAQNLLHSHGAVRALLHAADVRPGETVYDLGAGAGAITAGLVSAGARVVAVERDANLARKLRARFAGNAVRVVEDDLLRAPFRPPFKVVANPPFNLTGALLKRLLFETPEPELAALILQREAAQKYAGARRATAVWLTAAPWFELSVSYPFARRDFVPAPGVDVALLCIARRPAPALAEDQRAAWGAFVAYALARSRPDARRTFRNLVSNLQWRRLSGELGIAPDAMRDELTSDQWLGIFRFVSGLTHAPRRRRALA
jgi:23S rRNA (adenine-N6)-dimethyltransferase